MNITCRLQTDKLSVLLTFHAFQSTVFRSSCIPKPWYMKWEASTTWSSTTYIVPGDFRLPHRKMGTKQKARGGRAEPGCSWRMDPDSSMASFGQPPHNCRALLQPLYPLVLGALNILVSLFQSAADHATGTIPWSQLGQRARHSSVGRWDPDLAAREQERRTIATVLRRCTRPDEAF